MNKSVYLIGILILLVIGIAWYVLSARPATEPTKITETDLTTGEKQSAQSEMSFFITSVNPGKGADLDGLSGADNYCQSLATQAGAGNRTWRAYLSTQGTDKTPAVNARDRIGNGPWKNAKGVVIAQNLEELHTSNNINKQTALNEKGEEVKGRGDDVNWHDILTGSTPQGQAFEPGDDKTCQNWTSSTEGSAMVGHHDRLGLRDDDASKSWNSSHLTRGCSLELLATTGSAGLMYCFAE